MKPRLVPRHPDLGLVIIVVTAIVATSYFLERPRQSHVEQRAIGSIASWLKLFEAMHPSEPLTNISQFFDEISHGYPYVFHEEFRIFGRHAGFERSVAEKYLFIDPPLKIAGGDAVLLSAKPYPVGAGFERSGLYRTGDGYMIGRWPERRVQEAFVDAQRSIPLPPPAPTPPPPPPDYLRGTEPFWQGISTSFSRLEWSGIPAKRIPLIKSAVMGAVCFIILSALAFSFWPVTVIRLPFWDQFGPPLTDEQKVTRVILWTGVVSVLTIGWAMMPTVGGSQVPFHVIGPYWMIAHYWHGRGAEWMFVPLLLQFPIYGCIIASAWKKDRLLGGMAIVTCAHVGAMLLSVLMANSK